MIRVPVFHTKRLRRISPSGGPLRRARYDSPCGWSGIHSRRLTAKRFSSSSKRDSPQAAITIDDRIREQVDGLEQFPESGRPGRVEGTRELVIQRTPYIVAYRIVGDTVQILRVLHGSRQWPEDIR